MVLITLCFDIGPSGLRELCNGCGLLYAKVSEEFRVVWTILTVLCRSERRKDEREVSPIPSFRLCD